jgi:hypothetical protein
LARLRRNFELGFEHRLVVVVARTQHHPVLAERGLGWPKVWANAGRRVRFRDCARMLACGAQELVVVGTRRLRCGFEVARLSPQLCTMFQ